jgi:ABC-type branched-subunit amino acid transport system substrate-binding protein
LLAAAAVLLAGTAACGGDDAEDEGDAAAGDASEVHFVISTGLTGQSAFFGKGAWLATQLLRDQVNEAGGLKDDCGNTYTVKLTIFDDADDPETSVASFQKAAGDESVLGVIGSDSDVAWLPQLPLAGSLKMPLIVPSDGSEIEEDKWNPYAFRVFGSAGTTFQVATEKLKNAVGFSRVAVLYDLSQDGQTAEAELWRQFASELG